MRVHIGERVDPDALLSLSQAARLLPHPPHPSTLWRWRTKGANGVRLQMIRVGGRWYVRCRDLNDFISAQTESALQPTKGLPAEAVRTSAIREQLVAERLLEEEPTVPRESEGTVADD